MKKILVINVSKERITSSLFDLRSIEWLKNFSKSKFIFDLIPPEKLSIKNLSTYDELIILTHELTKNFKELISSIKYWPNELHLFITSEEKINIDFLSNLLLKSTSKNIHYVVTNNIDLSKSAKEIFYENKLALMNLIYIKRSY